MTQIHSYHICSHLLLLLIHKLTIVMYLHIYININWGQWDVYMGRWCFWTYRKPGDVFELTESYQLQRIVSTTQGYQISLILYFRSEESKMVVSQPSCAQIPRSRSHRLGFSQYEVMLRNLHFRTFQGDWPWMAVFKLYSKVLWVFLRDS